MDQAFVPTVAPNCGMNISLDVQQEFTPTMNQLDTVQLWINEGSSVPVPLPQTSGSLAVQIRDPAIDSGLMGRSTVMDLPARFQGTALFRFPNPVNLEPGHVYLLQPIVVAGANWFVNYNCPQEPSYPGGRLFFNGTWMDDLDIFFAEGVGIPEPSPSVLLAVGLALIFGVTLRSRVNRRARSPCVSAGWCRRRASFTRRPTMLTRSPFSISVGRLSGANAAAKHPR
jgi:hypothetical protein